MTKKALPHHPQDSSSSEERLMLTHKRIAEICVDGNDPVTPEKLIAWLQKQNTEGWSNLRVRAYVNPGDENNLEHHYIVLQGDRLENNKEWKDRQEHITAVWQRDYEEYLRNKFFFEETETGKARLEHIEKNKKRPISHPRKS